MKNYEILTHSGPGFIVGNDWYNHYSFAPDIETARAISSSIKKDFKEVVILNLKRNIRVF